MGPVNLPFDVKVTNPTNESMTLRRLDLRTIGGSSLFLRPTGSR